MMTHNLSEYELMHSMAVERGEEIERLRAALEFYANDELYEIQPISVGAKHAHLPVMRDKGKRARAALTPPDNGIAESE